MSYRFIVLRRFSRWNAERMMFRKCAQTPCPILSRKQIAIQMTCSVLPCYPVSLIYDIVRLCQHKTGFIFDQTIFGCRLINSFDVNYLNNGTRVIISKIQTNGDSWGVSRFRTTSEFTSMWTLSPLLVNPY